MTSNGTKSGTPQAEDSNSNSSAHAWSDLPSQLSAAVAKLGKLLEADDQFQAFANTKAITTEITFGVKSAGTDNTILITVNQAAAHASSSNDSSKACFTLCALPQQWEEFFKLTPVAPYQSYW